MQYVFSRIGIGVKRFAFAFFNSYKGLLHYITRKDLIFMEKIKTMNHRLVGSHQSYLVALLPHVWMEGEDMGL